MSLSHFSLLDFTVSIQEKPNSSFNTLLRNSFSQISNVFAHRFYFPQRLGHKHNLAKCLAALEQRPPFFQFPITSLTFVGDLIRIQPLPFISLPTFSLQTLRCSPRRLGLSLQSSAGESAPGLPSTLRAQQCGLFQTCISKIYSPPIPQSQSHFHISRNLL